MEMASARDKLARAEKAAADHDVQPATQLAEQRMPMRSSPRPRRSKNAPARPLWNKTPICKRCARNPCAAANPINEDACHEHEISIGNQPSRSHWALAATTPKPNAARKMRARPYKRRRPIQTSPSTRRWIWIARKRT